MKINDPEAYAEELKKGRERAHKSYKSRVKKEFPHAKVQRRRLK